MKTMTRLPTGVSHLRCGRTLAVLAAGVFAVASGCGKKTTGGPAGAPTPTHVAGTPHTDDVLDAWKGAGLKPEGFASLQPPPYVAAYCERGTVTGIDTLVCEYADDAALDRGQQQLKDEWTHAGVHTGVAVRTKRTLLSVVDRERHDPNGKTINQLIQAFRKL
jgi:hypothetical protein